MHRLRLIAAILLGLWVVALPARAADTSTLEIASKTGVHAFTVELAQTEAARARRQRGNPQSEQDGGDQTKAMHER